MKMFRMYVCKYLCMYVCYVCYVCMYVCVCIHLKAARSCAHAATNLWYKFWDHAWFGSNRHFCIHAKHFELAMSQPHTSSWHIGGYGTTLHIDYFSGHSNKYTMTLTVIVTVTEIVTVTVTATKPLRRGCLWDVYAFCVVFAWWYYPIWWSCHVSVTSCGLVEAAFCICYGYGHGHGVFILATHPKGKWTTNPNSPCVTYLIFGMSNWSWRAVTVTVYLF